LFMMNLIIAMRINAERKSSINAEKTDSPVILRIHRYTSLYVNRFKSL
jgi:hypothetical protein